MIQHQDEATVHAGRQLSKSVESGVSDRQGLEDARYESVW